jgi:hypothetical protein
MKIKLLLSALLSFVFYLLSSQVPQGFNYQAIARDGSGIALANQALPAKIAIQTSLTGGTLIYEELFASVTSNQFGLISLVVGTGTQTGGSAASFSAIDWKAQTLYLKTIIQYPGTTWTTMGTSQIWGVPYSLVAKEVAGPLAKLGITGTTDVMDEALFEVKNKAGNTVFAVYNEGIRAYVGNGKAKGIKGGFSVGGYDATKGSTIYDLFTLSTDSARLYFDSKPDGKGIKGGFSVGGYDMTKGGISPQNYLNITPDSTRVYVNEPSSAISKNGFSVRGRNPISKLEGDYMNLSKYTSKIYSKSDVSTGKEYTSWNLLLNELGHIDTINILKASLAKLLMTIPYTYAKGDAATFEVMIKEQTKGPIQNIVKIGTSNIGLGIGARNQLSGESNIAIGRIYGSASSEFPNSGSENVLLGFSNWHSAANYNVLIGSGMNVAGSYNVFLGADAGNKNLSNDNIFIGHGAGYNNIGVHSSNGFYNIFMGSGAGYGNTTGSSNIMIGTNAGLNNSTGSNNTIIGSNAGSTILGNNNVIIGFYAGSQETGSNKLYIDNTNTTSPLIYGDFTNGSEMLVFNGNVGIGTNTPGYKLQVGNAADGSQARANAWNLLSDASLKTTLIKPDNSLEMIEGINGYYFYWKSGSDKTRQFGFIAQEVEKVLPEIISKGEDGLLSLDYGKVTPLLVEAIKQQQRHIEQQQQQIDNQQKEIDELKTLVNNLK